MPTTVRRPVHALAIILLATAALPAPSRADEAAEQLLRATYKLANASSTASGLAVSLGEETPADSPRCHLVSAHHVFEAMTGDFCVLVSRVARSDGTFDRREIRIPIRSNGRDLWRRHPNHDLAALPLSDDVAGRVESIPIGNLASEELLAGVHTGDAVRLAVFPERSEANGAGFAILRSGSLASFPLLPVRHHPLFLVDTTAWTGDSGGPVMHATRRAPDGGPLVVGIVLGMRNISDSVQESRFIERTTHYPLGLSEVLHAAFVRELLDGSDPE